MFCSQCGKSIPDMAVFCPYCGEKIRFVESEEQMDTSEPIHDVSESTTAEVEPAEGSTAGAEKTDELYQKESLDTAGYTPEAAIPVIPVLEKKPVEPVVEAAREEFVPKVVQDTFISEATQKESPEENTPENLEAVPQREPLDQAEQSVKEFSSAENSSGEELLRERLGSEPIFSDQERTFKTDKSHSGQWNSAVASTEPVWPIPPQNGESASRQSVPKINTFGALGAEFIRLVKERGRSFAMRRGINLPDSPLKKIVLVILAVVLIFAGIGFVRDHFNDQKRILGTWVAVEDDDNLVTFFEDGTCYSSDEGNARYSIGDGKLVITNMWGIDTCSYRFSFGRLILTMGAYDQEVVLEKVT